MVLFRATILETCFIYQEIGSFKCTTILSTWRSTICIIEVAKICNIECLYAKQCNTDLIILSQITVYNLIRLVYLLKNRIS